MYQSGRAGDEAKKRKSPAKSGRVGISELLGGPDLYRQTEACSITDVIKAIEIEMDWAHTSA